MNFRVFPHFCSEKNVRVTDLRVTYQKKHDLTVALGGRKPTEHYLFQGLQML
jgi:hypothetical protein